MLTNFTFPSSSLQLGYRPFSFVSNPLIHRLVGCLCVSGCNIQDTWSLDFWQVINGNGFISLLPVIVLAISASGKQLPRAGSWWERGLREHVFGSGWCINRSSACMVIEETLHINSQLPCHPASHLLFSGFEESRGRWGISSAHLPVWNLERIDSI